MRWDSYATLQRVATEQQPDGSFKESVEETGAYVNRTSMGATAWLAARSAGLHADATVQIRTCDYAGQEQLVMDGTTYGIEKAQAKGEITTLTLSRRLRNG